MKKLSLLLTSALLLSFALTYADGPQTQGQGRHNNQAVQQYVKEHIMPVLREKRALVETELTTAEKDELATDRAALKQLFQQQKEVMQQKPDGVSMREYMHSDEVQAQMHQFHQQMRDIVEKAQAIANNHLPTLDNIHNDLQPSREQWKTDISNLRQAQRQSHIQSQNQSQELVQPQDQTQPQEQLQLQGQRQPYQWAGRGQMKSGGMHGGGMEALFDGKYAYAHFLLMPATSSSAATSDDEIDQLKSLLDEPATTSNAVTSFQLLPNPASSELVTGNDKIPVNNEFKLIDMQGRVALTLQNIQPAQHINVSQLPSGTYLAQLSSNSGQTIENKIVISH